MGVPERAPENDDVGVPQNAGTETFAQWVGRFVMSVRAGRTIVLGYRA
jgi:hypothetical protein